MRPSNAICKCNLPCLKYFKDSLNPASWSAGKVWTVLGVSYLLVGSRIFFLYEKRIVDNFPFQDVWGLHNGSFIQNLVNFVLYQNVFILISFGKVFSVEQICWNLLFYNLPLRISLSFITVLQFCIKISNLTANFTFRIFLVEIKLFMEEFLYFRSYIGIT